MNWVLCESAVFLLWNSITDMKKKRVSLTAIIIFFLLHIVHLIVSPGIAGSLKQVVIDSLAGSIPGVLLCCLSVLSRGSIGLGDGLLVTVLGVVLGLSLSIEILLWALCIAFFWSVFMLIVKRYGKMSRFPFVPFLLIGFCISLF